VQCEGEQAGDCEKSVSTTSPLGPAVVMDVDSRRSSSCAGASRQIERLAGLAGLTHTLSRETSGGEGNADTRRPCCFLLLCPEAAERLLGRRKGDDAVLGRATGDARRSRDRERRGRARSNKGRR
jgi:hypothetical protein